MTEFTKVGPDTHTAIGLGVDALGWYPLMARVRQRGSFLLPKVSCENSPDVQAFLGSSAACPGLLDSTSTLWEGRFAGICVG